MEFNFLPTDNIYKFLALSGLFILIFSFYYNSQKIDELNSEYFNHVNDQDKYTLSLLEHNKELATNSQTLTSRLMLLQEKNRLGSEVVNYLGKKNITKEEAKKIDQWLFIGELINKQNQSLDSLENKLNDSERQSKLDSLQFYAKKVFLKYKESRVDYYNRVLTVGAIIGFLISIIGFIGWYRHQHLIDSQIKSKV